MKTSFSHNRTFAAFFALALTASVCWGAKMPLSAKDLVKQSTHIVSGKVVAIESCIRKSTIEKSRGNQDEIFAIKVVIDAIIKGEDIDEADQILVVAWKPHRRVGLAGIGLQGHVPIPERGQTATFYLRETGMVFEPLMPNGIEIKHGAQDDAADAKTSTKVVEPWKDRIDEIAEDVAEEVFRPNQKGNEAAIEVAKAHVTSNLTNDHKKLADTYAPELMLMPGHEYLKEKYGLAGSGARGKGAEVERDKLLSAMEKATADRPGLPKEDADRILGKLKYELIEVHEGDFATQASDPVAAHDGKLHFKIKEGDCLIRVSPPKGDFVLLQLRMQEGSWRVVSEYLD